MDRFVSVVIPTLNSEGTIAECLKSIFSNDNPPKFEVMVVDGGSTDNTVKIAGEYPVKLLYADKPQANQRNVAVAQTSGDIIAFTDSDVRVTANWLYTLVRHFDDPSISGVGGPNLTPEDDQFWAKCFGTLMESPLGSAGVRNTVIYKNIREVNHNPPVNSAVRKNVFLEVGGFGKGYEPVEDVVLDAKIKRKGYKLIYDPAMIVWHHRRKTLSGFTKQLFLYGRGRASVFLKYPESLPFTYFCTAAFTLGTILSLPIYLLINALQPIIICGWIAYLVFIVLASIYTALKKRRFVLFLILPFLAIYEHFTLGLGFITGIVKPFKGS
jgi:GT2 family glycosyltransferase